MLSTFDVLEKYKGLTEAQCRQMIIDRRFPYMQCPMHGCIMVLNYTRQKERQLKCDFTRNGHNVSLTKGTVFDSVITLTLWFKALALLRNDPRLRSFELANILGLDSSFGRRMKVKLQPYAKPGELLDGVIVPEPYVFKVRPER